MSATAWIGHAFVVVAACSAPPSAHPPPPPATPTPFEQAVAYERGHGVTRDFRKAGELFGKLCGGGAGELRACDKLLEVASRFADDRGDPETMRRMCDRGDKLACIIELPGGKDDISVLRARGIDLDALP